MNAILRHSLDGEILSPNEMVRAIGRTHPLNGGRVECYVRAGLSITEILTEALADRPSMVLRRDFIVHIDGHVIEERNWSRVRVKAGATLTFTPRLQDGSFLRTALSIVLVIAATVVAGPWGTAFAASAAGAAIGISAAVATALIGAGLILAGTLALNALFPTRPPEQVTNEAPGSLISIQGAQNQASPFGPIPVILGRHRITPYRGASVYTELVGDDQYLRLLFCVGYGPLKIEDLKIGETPIGSFEGCQIEIRQGFANDPPITLYPASVDEQALSITLENFGSPPGQDTNDGDWHGQTTADDTDQISVDFTAPQGMFVLNPQSGAADPYYVNVSVRYRLAGSGAEWTDVGDVKFSRSVSPCRRGVVWSVPRGQYEVQSRKHTANANSDRAKDVVVWTALRSIKNMAPISFPKPLALVALRIKATDQLNGVIDTFNCVATSLVQAYAGEESSWTINTASQWPSDLYRHVLQGPANARPVSDAQIDLGNLQEWWAYCVLKGFKFNQVLTTAGSVYDKLADIAAAGRGVPTWIDGKWGVLWDRPDDSIVQHLTPRNSWGFKGQRAYAQQPHGWRVSFINEGNGFSSDERIVYDDGWNESNATLFEGIQFPGVTDPDLIWKHGRFQIAQQRLRPETVTINTGWEHLVCTRGDRVRVTHDVLLIGLSSGRVKSVDGQALTFDEVLTIEADKTYGIQFRVPEDERSLTAAVDPATPAGEYTSLTVVGDVSLVSRGTLFGFGETGQESAVYRVKGIANQKDLIATLTLVDDAPEISQADQGDIPPYNPNITVPPSVFTLAPSDFRYVEAVDGQGNSVRAITRLSWAAARRGKIDYSELQIQRASDGWLPLNVLPYPQFTLDVPLQSPDVWSYRVRFQFSDNSVSNWAVLENLTLLGLSAAPPDVQNIRATAYVDNTTSISFDEVTDYRPVRYAIRQGDNWESAIELGTLAHPPFSAHGGGNYLVKAYVGADAARAYSVNAASILVVGSSLVRNVIATRDEAADGWNGVFGGTAGKSGSFIRTGGTDDFLSLPNILDETDILNRGGQGNGTYEISQSRYIDAGRATPCRVTITWKGTSQIVTDDFLANPDILNNPDILAAGSSDLIEVYPEISVAQNNVVGDVFTLDPSKYPDNDIFSVPDVFNADISFGPWIKWEPGLYVGRYFRARLVLKTRDPQVVAVALAFTFTVDVPDRLDNWALVGGVGTSLSGITVPSGGLTIVFASNGMTIAEPFNGGPNTDEFPVIQITNTDAQPYDFEVTNLSKNGCTIVPRLAGVPTDAPKTNISIQGW